MMKDQKLSIAKKAPLKKRLIVCTLLFFTSLSFLGNIFFKKYTLLFTSTAAILLFTALLLTFHYFYQHKSKNITFALVIIAFTTALGFFVGSFISPAEANKPLNNMAETNNSKINSPLQETINKISYFQNQLVPVPQNEAFKAIEMAKTIKYIPRSKAVLLWKDAIVTSYHENTIVSVPFSGLSELKVTNRLTFFFNKNTIDTFEMFIKDISNKEILVKTWINGVESTNQISSVYSQKSIIGETIPLWLDWGKLNDCLSKKGISSWALAGMSIVCGAACAGTLGAGCVACISFAAGFFAGSTKPCIERAWY